MRAFVLLLTVALDPVCAFTLHRLLAHSWSHSSGRINVISAEAQPAEPVPWKLRPVPPALRELGLDEELWTGIQTKTKQNLARMQSKGLPDEVIRAKISNLRRFVAEETPGHAGTESGGSNDGESNADGNLTPVAADTVAAEVPRAEEPAPAPAQPKKTARDRLLEVQELHNSGLLSDEEYAQLRADIIDAL